jgi:hypothetical protein
LAAPPVAVCELASLADILCIEQERVVARDNTVAYEFCAPFLFGYAKPVPVNFRALGNPRIDMAWVAAAGPTMNIGLGTPNDPAIRFTREVLRGNMAITSARLFKGGAAVWSYLTSLPSPSKIVPLALLALPRRDAKVRGRCRGFKVLHAHRPIQAEAYQQNLGPRGHVSLAIDCRSGAASQRISALGQLRTSQ